MSANWTPRAGGQLRGYSGRSRGGPGGGISGNPRITKKLNVAKGLKKLKHVKTAKPLKKGSRKIKRVIS